MLAFTARAWTVLSQCLIKAEKDHSNHEIQWFGRLVEQNDGSFLCTEVDMPEQTTQSAHIDTSCDEFMEWQFNKFLKDLDPDKVGEVNEEIQKWRLWIHSHNSMSAKYSPTDLETIQDLADATKEYFFGVVINNDLDTQGYIAVALPNLPAVVTKSMTTIRELKEIEIEFKATKSIRKDVDRMFLGVKKREYGTLKKGGGSGHHRKAGEQKGFRQYPFGGYGLDLDEEVYAAWMGGVPHIAGPNTSVDTGTNEKGIPPDDYPPDKWEFEGAPSTCRGCKGISYSCKETRYLSGAQQIPVIRWNFWCAHCIKPELDCECKDPTDVEAMGDWILEMNRHYEGGQDAVDDTDHHKTA